LGCADPLVVGQDGALKKGVTVPEGTSRFTDNENGTVTDNLTGLIWLKNATCFGAVNWDTALALSNTLEASAMACGLTDGSKAGDWRLPNIRELSSLVDASAYSPALTAAYPFLNVLTDKSYQSSTTDSFADAYRLSIIMTTGAMNKSVAGALNYFWPVRGPQ
jgi:hypothetical protein